jgi:pimeloyl-ACP methyl ester carboxylesterase
MDPLDVSHRLLRGCLGALGVRSRALSLNGYTVHCYEKRGPSGPPVVLVHGLGGCANGYFRLMVPLARRFSRVLALDLPGHGFSPLPEAGPLPLSEYLGLLETFGDEWVGEPAFWVGNSLGAALALLLAQRKPEAASALALLAPAGAPFTAEQYEELASSMRVASAAQARALMRKIFHQPPMPAMVFSFLLQKMFGTPPVLAALEEAKLDLFLSPAVLSEVAPPTLLLWGESDRLLPRDGLDYFRRHLPPHSRIEAVPGFGHVPQLEQARQVAERLIHFADEQRL